MNTRKTAKSKNFEELYRETYNDVVKYMTGVTGDPIIADDMTSEAFIKAEQHFDSFDTTQAKFSTWVITIAKNCYRDYLRRANTQHETPDERIALHAEFSEELPENGANGARARIEAFEDDYSLLFDFDEDASVDLDELLDVLTEDERTVVQQRFYAGKTNKDIAADLGLSPSTVSTRLQKALGKMRECLENDMERE